MLKVPLVPLIPTPGPGAVQGCGEGTRGLGGKGLRAWRAAGPRWSGCRSSGDSFGGLMSRKRAVRLGI